MQLLCVSCECVVYQFACRPIVDILFLRVLLYLYNFICYAQNLYENVLRLSFRPFMLYYCYYSVINDFCLNALVFLSTPSVYSLAG